MKVISAKNVIVEFPIYGIKTNRSIKKVIVRTATGGLLGRDSAERIVVRALDSVSLDVYGGDRIGIVGHNGSGKSTLLRLFAGIYEPLEGNIEINGRVTSMLDIFLGMDMEATGLENIIMRGRMMGIRPKEMRAKLDDIIDFTSLGDYLHLPLRSYSHGMVMRLAFATSTSIDSEIILMDEWLNIGDTEFKENAIRRLDKLLNKDRVFAIATHDWSIIKSLCNKVIKLDHGKIASIVPISKSSANVSDSIKIDTALHFK